MTKRTKLSPTPVAPARAPVIAFVGEKGGSGKSTLAVSLAVEWCARGHRVRLVDADTQGSVRVWHDVAQETHAPHMPDVQFADGEDLYDALPELGEGFDLVVVDCPGRDNATQRAALLRCDLALLPSGPSLFDASALMRSAVVVADARVARRALNGTELDAAVVLARLMPGTVLARRARRSLERVGLPLLDTELALRNVYLEALGAGRGPTTYATTSAASAEVRRLATEVERRVGLAAIPKRAVR